MLASQPYVVITRKIEANEQHIIETEEYLYLYKDVVETAEHLFKLADVFDMSFRVMTEEFGFLYLHTKKGVFSYNVQSNPYEFIEAFKKL